jgi:hypothetical protein
MQCSFAVFRPGLRMRSQRWPSERRCAPDLSLTPRLPVKPAARAFPSQHHVPLHEPHPSDTARRLPAISTYTERGSEQLPGGVLAWSRGRVRLSRSTRTWRPRCPSSSGIPEVEIEFAGDRERPPRTCTIPRRPLSRAYPSIRNDIIVAGPRDREHQSDTTRRTPPDSSARPTPTRPRPNAVRAEVRAASTVQLATVGPIHLRARLGAMRGRRSGERCCEDFG